MSDGSSSPPAIGPRHGRFWARLAFALALGAMGGWIFAQLRMPLPWMIGAMCVTTAAALMRAPVLMPQSLRGTMIAVLGTMLGSAFKPEVLDHAVKWSGSLIGLLVLIVAIGGSVVFLLMRFGGLDRPTAYFSAAPGGFSEMLMLGSSHGGDERTISLFHSVRILLTVLIIPFWFRIVYGYTPGVATGLGGISDIQIADAAILTACAIVGYVVGKRIRIPAAALVGPMTLSAAAHLSGLTQASPPTEIVNLAQVVIGTGVGVRFAGVDARKMFRTMLLGAGISIYMLVVAAAFALVLEPLTGLPFTGLILAFSPGGLAEMTLISLALGIDTAFVSTHHLIRMVVLVIFAPLFYRLLAPKPAAPGRKAPDE